MAVLNSAFDVVKTAVFSPLFKQFLEPEMNCSPPIIVGWLVLLLYVPSQQLWSLRDGQFT